MSEDLESWNRYTKNVTKLDFSNNLPRANIPSKKRKISQQCYDNIESTIDLHGLTQDQAFDNLKNFLDASYNNNKKEVIVITGKGKLNSPGVIKLAVPRWLEYTELKKYILGYSWVQDSLGGSGSIRVMIKRRSR
ncbi:MAG: Smr/MutS family protein [Rickettsiales bacterium]|jgi:DNA-nicking Smr family endonuclease|nr:Smr/MutS family protein [Rickettsiales bacterium]